MAPLATTPGTGFQERTGCDAREHRPYLDILPTVSKTGTAYPAYRWSGAPYCRPQRGRRSAAAHRIGDGVGRRRFTSLPPVHLQPLLLQSLLHSHV